MESYERLLEVVELQESLIENLKKKDIVNEAIIERYEKLILLYEAKMKSIVLGTLN